MKKKLSINIRKSLSFRKSKEMRIWHFLKAELHLKSYSEIVLISLSNRFDISTEELKQRIAKFRAMEGRTDG